MIILIYSEYAREIFLLHEGTGVEVKNKNDIEIQINNT